MEMRERSWHQRYRLDPVLGVLDELLDIPAIGVFPGLEGEHGPDHLQGILSPVVELAEEGLLLGEGLGQPLLALPAHRDLRLQVPRLRGDLPPQE